MHGVRAGLSARAKPDGHQAPSLLAVAIGAARDAAPDPVPPALVAAAAAMDQEGQALLAHRDKAAHAATAALQVAGAFHRHHCAFGLHLSQK